MVLNQVSVSVIVPTYNRLDYLTQALDGVASQTFKDWECLVCDDGSNDGTVEFIRAKSLSDPRFRLVEGERFGLPAGPRNRGIREAKGDWIAFLDDDDLWHPLKLERQWSMCQKAKCDAVSVRSRPFIGSFDGFESIRLADSATKLNSIDIFMQRQPYPSTPATMVRREILLHCGGFSESPSYRAVEDFDLWCRLLSISEFVWLMDDGKSLVAYRDQGSDSISSWNATLSPDVIRQCWAVLECRNRVVAKDCTMLGDEKDLILGELLRGADDCAARSAAIGWRSATLNAFILAALYATLLHRPGEAGLRLTRAIRFVPLKVTDVAAPLPEWIPKLVRRTRRHAFNILRGQRSQAMPIPIDCSGRWSSLASATSQTGDLRSSTS